MYNKWIKSNQRDSYIWSSQFDNLCTKPLEKQEGQEALNRSPEYTGQVSNI